MTRFNLEQNKEALKQRKEDLITLWHYLVNTNRLTARLDEEIDSRLYGIDRILRHMPEEDGTVWLDEQDAAVVAGFTF